MPITSTALFVCGLSLIGLPLTAGFISKVYLVMALVSSSLWLVTGLVLISARFLVFISGGLSRPCGCNCAKRGKIAENPAVYLPLWLIALANIYFGLDARAVVDASFAASVSLGVDHDDSANSIDCWSSGTIGDSPACADARCPCQLA